MVQPAGNIVDEITAVSATTLAGLLVKMKAIAWCRCGDPIDADDLCGPYPGGRPMSTDMQLVLSVLDYLSAMAGIGGQA